MELEHEFNVITVSRNLLPFFKELIFLNFFKTPPLEKGGVHGMVLIAIPLYPLKKVDHMAYH